MFAVGLCLFMAFLNLTQAIKTVESQHRVFEIDYANDRFLKDGEPFRYVSGSLHYFRVPRVYWRDRLRKLRAAGLNAVCTYIEWSSHETKPGVYDFTGERDFVQFVKLAQEEDLLVILRPGPYICSERDFGGYPPWLLYENPSMVLRTNDSSHTKFVYSWLTVLLTKLQPLLYGNGGPVIMIQVENEYGSYWACDRDYTRWLRDVFRSYVGDKAVLFTTDGWSSNYLKCGPIPGVFTTVDFGAEIDVSEAFKPLRQIQQHGPLVNSEFYAGRLTHWGEATEAVIPTVNVVKSLKQLLTTNVSFNFYMFHGGSNFGFSSGANDPPFQPQITSYDFNAPISESGKLTEKYFAIQSVISEFFPVQNLSDNSPTTSNYGTVILEPKVSLFDSDVTYGEFLFPRSFEALQQYSGFILYQTVLPNGYSGGGNLTATGIHDRAIVYVNEEPAGLLNRTDSVYSLIIPGISGQPLGLLVENQGHINFGPMSDLKGLVKNVTLDGVVLTSWKHTGYPMTNVSNIFNIPSVESVKLPAFYAGRFEIPMTEQTPNDTFVDMSGWGKGVLYVNGNNLGRYWPTAGPQVTVYVPGSLLQQSNVVVIMELEQEHPYRKINLVADPIFKM